MSARDKRRRPRRVEVEYGALARGRRGARCMVGRPGYGPGGKSCLCEFCVKDRERRRKLWTAKA